MIQRILSGLFLSFMVLFNTLSAPLVNAQSTARSLIVVYVDGGTLYSWHDNSTPQPLVKMDGITRPMISPDGANVIFQQGDGLWFVGLNTPSDPKLLVSRSDLNAEVNGPRRILDVAWLDKNLVVFNTFNFKPQQLVQQEIVDDLWRVEVSTGKLIRMLDNGDGGAFTISPDRKHIAIVRTGNYTSGTQGSVTLIDTDGKSTGAQMKFPHINTGSSMEYYPPVHWYSEKEILVAIPDPDLVYATKKLPDTVIWYLKLGGEGASETGAVQADFFGLPQFSGDYIAYMRRTGDDLRANEITLYTNYLAGTSEHEVTSGKIGTIELPRPINESDGFSFVKDQAGEVYVISSDKTMRFPDAKTSAFNLVWAAGLGFYTTEPNGGELRVQVPFDTPHSDLIAKVTAMGDMDAWLAPEPEK